MSQNQNSTFMARASLFASPKDSAVIPKKRVAREGPLTTIKFPDESMSLQQSPLVHKTPEKSTLLQTVHSTFVDDEDEVEPMEVDMGAVPSPQKSQTPERGQTPCTDSTTPRRKSARKSMPTPGKRLFFTSKDHENDEREANETTQLELLMANVPEDMSANMKALIQDKKEMGEYEIELRKEINEFEAVLKTRQTMHRIATEVVNEGVVSSSVPTQIAPLDLSFKKEETPDQICRRLHGKFLIETQEAGKQRKAQREAMIAEEENFALKNTLEQLEKLQETKEQIENELKEAYQQERLALEQSTMKSERIGKLARSLKPIPLF